MRLASPLLALAVCSSPLPLFAVDYKEEIRPILNEKCFKCHSGPRAKGKLRMDQESMFSDRIGGDDPVIEPGNPNSSLLAIKAGLPPSDGDAMPPPPARSRGAEPMTAAELNLVKQWIAEGDALEPGGAKMTSSETTSGDSGDGEEFHEWTNFEGNKLKAAFVVAEPGTVVLKDENGQEIRYPFDKLDSASQELARKLATQ